MTTNTQNLPAGLAARAAQAALPSMPAPAAGAAAGAAPTPAYVPEPTPAAAPAAAAPAAQPAPVNPMLSHVSQNPAPAEALPELGEQKPAEPVTLGPVPVPAADTPPVVDEAPAGSVTELAGVFAEDVNLAPAVNYLDSFCKDKGIDVVRAFGKASDEGDARFIDEAYLREKLGDDADKIIKTGTGILDYIVQYQEQSISSAIAGVGGEGVWRQSVTVFNEKAGDMDKQVVADLLDSGIRAKIEHAAKLVAKFAAEAGGAVVHHQPGLGQPGNQKGMTKDEYIKAISERNISPERYEELKSLRKLGMSQGV